MTTLISQQHMNIQKDILDYSYFGYTHTTHYFLEEIHSRCTAANLGQGSLAKEVLNLNGISPGSNKG